MTIILVISLLIMPFFPNKAEAKIRIPDFGKVIVIDQHNQWGKAYENGKEIFSFPILSGDDETPTGNGKYRVEKKIKNYFSRRYKVPMPYSLFFVFNNHCRKAIHEGEVPKSKRERQEKWATHGCIHAEMKVIKKLFYWVDEKTTEVIVFGER